MSGTRTSPLVPIVLAPPMTDFVPSCRSTVPETTFRVIVKALGGLPTEGPAVHVAAGPVMPITML
jgi:hypothetical protein